MKCPQNEFCVWYRKQAKALFYRRDGVQIQPTLADFLYQALVSTDALLYKIRSKLK